MSNTINNLQEFTNRLKSIYGLASSLAVIIPGILFFADYSPPLFGTGIWILVTSLSIFLIIIFLNQNINNKNKVIQRSILCIVLSLILFSVYFVLFDFSTATIASDNQKEVYQVGFGTFDWTLTKYGIDSKNRWEARKQTPITNTELVKTKPGKENITKLWKSWSYYSAGFLLIIIYILSVLFWIYGWCYIANTQVLESKQSP